MSLNSEVHMRGQEFWVALADRFERQAKEAESGRRDFKKAADYRTIANIYRGAASGNKLVVCRAEELESDRFRWNGPIKGLEHLWQEPKKSKECRFINSGIADLGFNLRHAQAHP
jgi:hypothetical protein